MEPGNILTFLDRIRGTDQTLLESEILLSVREASLVIPTPIMCFPFAWKKMSAWHVVAAESPACSIVL